MRLALLTNFIPPYRLPVLRALRDRVGQLRVLVSTEMEADRPWQRDFADLDVVVQSTWSFQRVWTHERFRQGYQLHVPYDTIPQLRRFRPDAILTAEFGPRSIQAVAFARAARVPVVIWATLTDHLERSRGRLREWVRRGLLPMTDRIVVNGESGARYIRSIGGQERRIVPVWQAVALDPWLTIPLARHPSVARRLLFVGAVSELKGAALLLRAARGWAQRHPEESLGLTMVGDGPLRASLQREPSPPNLEVEWVGALEYRELPGCYARCGILVFPTQGDEWGLVVNEALAAGLPVIGSVYSQAVDELVVDESNGWRFRPDDADSIERALDRALRTPSPLLDQMRAKARASVALLTPERMADQLFDAVASQR